ncbi:peptidoglycan bridge formation glycyltransferase FemA/FemB family protein [Clostridium estertheticum]|uniref:peptidoglycan bridge formation glycyltransferase FemA/FemB family protein n=2 Tax=Clostridium TaxID=1485 RepID=UPI001C0C8435|nr:peptidoglycan bridge formation glycyltransferase FemA/FemB family protein [Clostridium estertheticum]MBU3175921.1 peptidoglycan bridge formation glycyltransferase FemA/FemB family protein [Clostridium estertheticum]
MKILVNCINNLEELPTGILNKIDKTNMFYTDDYANLIKDQGGKVYYIYTCNYIMPISIMKSYIFKWANILSECYSLSDYKSESVREFLDVCMEYMKKKLKIEFVEMSPTYAFFEDYPTKGKRIPFGSHVIDLTQTEDEIYNNMKSRCKKSIKTAQNKELTIKRGRLEILNDYLKIDKETWKRSNINDDHTKLYTEIIENLPNNAIIFITYLGDEAQGGAIYFYDHNICNSIYGARKNKPVNGSRNFLHWEVMKYMKKEGVSLFSLVGCRINEDKNSKAHGIQMFKESFGPELKKSFLFKVVFNNFMYILYNFVRAIKTRNFYKDIIDQEIHKWKDIN